MPLDDNLLDAIAETIADTEQEFRKQLDAIRESIEGRDGIDDALAVYDASLFEQREAIVALRTELAATEQRQITDVLEKLREDRLDLDEALFAARKRYDRLASAFEERLADIRDGEPGPPGECGEQGPEGVPGRSFCLRGTWVGINDYQAMDVVTKDGASFAARSDHPGPCPGDGWQMIARGNRGNQGERGAVGAKGERGEPGAPVVAMSVSEEGMLTLTNGDGSEVICDLYPVLSRMAR